MSIGIVEETGILPSVKGGSPSSRLVIGAGRILEDIKRGDSITVSGVCLAAVSFDSGRFLADVMPETLKCSNPGCLPIKSSFNLERAMITGGRFGGYIVSGRIDGTGTIVNIVRDGNTLRHTTCSAPSILCRIIEKGSITIDGVSLMVAQVREQDPSASLIPHTVSHTTLGALKPGRVASLEGDCVGRYIKRLMKVSPFAHSMEGEDTKNRRTGNRITPELLKQYGFWTATERDH